jgi:hypothetical protein
MDDALFVCGFERAGDLRRDRERLVQRHRALCDAIRQRGPLDELHDERDHATALLEAVDLRDVRMVERRSTSASR